MKVDFIRHGVVLNGQMTLAALPKRFIDATLDFDPALEEAEESDVWVYR